MDNFKDQQKFNEESLKYNTLKANKPFTRKRIRLDNARSFSDILTDNNFTQAFRGFWVVETNNSDFKLEMKVNIQNTLGDSLPLRSNMNYDFGQMVNGARFEFEAQAGTYVDILFFHVGGGQLGNVELETTGSVSVTTGTSFETDSIEIGDYSSPTSFPAKENRVCLFIKNLSESQIYFSEDLAKLSGAGWSDKCMHINPGETLKWTNKAGFVAKSGTSSTAKIKFLEEYL